MYYLIIDAQFMDVSVVYCVASVASNWKTNTNYKLGKKWNLTGLF